MKKYGVKDILMAVLFFLGFIGGILFVNLWGSTYLKTDQFLNGDVLEMIRRVQIDEKSLFFFVLAVRGKWFLLFWLLGHTLAGLPIALLFLGWLGFSMGVFAGIFVVQLQMLGILIFLAAILPQAFLYAPSAWLMIGAACERGALHIRKREAQDTGQGEKTYMRSVALALALFLAGAALESSINPWLLKQVLNYFF